MKPLTSGRLKTEKFAASVPVPRARMPKSIASASASVVESKEALE